MQGKKVETIYSQAKLVIGKCVCVCVCVCVWYVVMVGHVRSESEVEAVMVSRGLVVALAVSTVGFSWLWFSLFS
jgi:hypothetical protein